MRERTILLIFACTTFAVTAGISAWHEGLWHTGDSPSAQDVENARRTRTLLSASAASTVSGRPFAPAGAAPAAAATAAAAPAPPPEPTSPPTPMPAPAAAIADESGTPIEATSTQNEPQSEPSISPLVDNAEVVDPWDRAARHGPRAR